MLTADDPELPINLKLCVRVFFVCLVWFVVSVLEIRTTKHTNHTKRHEQHLSSVQFFFELFKLLIRKSLTPVEFEFIGVAIFVQLIECRGERFDHFAKPPLVRKKQLPVRGAALSSCIP